EYYDSVRHPTCQNFRDSSRTLIRSFLSKRDQSYSMICEVGPGNSLVAEYLNDQRSTAENLYLIDSSIGMLAYSFEYSQAGAKFVIGDAERLPFAEGSFDIVVASLGDPYNTARFWEEVAHILRTKAWCVFTTPSFEWASHYRTQSKVEEEGLALFDLANGER